MNFQSHAIADRLRAHWRAKFWLGAVLTVAFCIGYFGLQRIDFVRPRSLPSSPIDDWIAFDSRWSLVYQSMYLLLPIAWLARTREQLARYACGFVLIGAIGFLFFLLFPVVGPRPVHASTGLLGVIHAYDTPLNCFPSLHVALATYSACFAVQIFRTSVLIRAALVTWIGLIAYSTLAIKQHYFVDVPAGVALGWLGKLAAKHYRTREPIAGVAVGNGEGSAEGSAA